MNESLNALSIQRCLDNSPFVVLKRRVISKINFVHSFSPFIYGVFEHSVEDSSFLHFLSKVSVLVGKLDVSVDIRYKLVRFNDIHSNGNGGCILCQSEVDLEIVHCVFYDIFCKEEGGAIFVTKASLTLTRSCFELCRTSLHGNQVGGNAWNIGGKLIQISDIDISRCWINTQCGDSICMFNDGNIEVKHKNSTNCIDNLHGEDICCERFYKVCSDSYIHTFNCTLAYAHSIEVGNGARTTSFSNIISCDLTMNFLYQSGCRYDLVNCCFFDLTKTKSYGSPKLENCIGDFESNGIRKVESISTITIRFINGCAGSLFFTSMQDPIELLMLIWNIFLN